VSLAKQPAVPDRKPVERKCNCNSLFCQHGQLLQSDSSPSSVLLHLGYKPRRSFHISSSRLQVEKGAEWDRVASEAARTVPGRENGGNCDIKNLSRGCKVYFPVFVEGANLSMGDMHFSQGDGEVSFCGAIEMSGFLELK
jgi:acetamidase/formamidase